MTRGNRGRKAVRDCVQSGIAWSCEEEGDSARPDIGTYQMSTFELEWINSS
jgi:hypothetical protein